MTIFSIFLLAFLSTIFDNPQRQCVSEDYGRFTKWRSGIGVTSDGAVFVVCMISFTRSWIRLPAHSNIEDLVHDPTFSSNQSLIDFDVAIRTLPY